MKNRYLIFGVGFIIGDITTCIITLLYMNKIEDDTVSVTKDIEYIEKNVGCYYSGDDDVPDAETAIKVAQPILYKIFGYENIMIRQPFSIQLINDSVWYIRGSVPKKYNGGDIIIKMSKKNATIYEIYGEK